MIVSIRVISAAVDTLVSVISRRIRKKCTGKVSSVISAGTSLAMLCLNHCEFSIRNILQCLRSPCAMQTSKRNPSARVERRKTENQEMRMITSTTTEMEPQKTRSEITHLQSSHFPLHFVPWNMIKLIHAEKSHNLAKD